MHNNPLFFLFVNNYNLNELSNLKKNINIIYRNYDDNIDTIDFDIKPKLEEKINIDIKRFRNILKNKFENKFENKNYERILAKYDIYNKSSISKNMMNDIIKEIMLN
mgnify:CR=1 FL=1